MCQNYCALQLGGDSCLAAIRGGHRRDAQNKPVWRELSPEYRLASHISEPDMMAKHMYILLLYNKRRVVAAAAGLKPLMSLHQT